MGPINYFEGLGFGRAMDRPMQVAGQAQALRANEQDMDIRQQQADMERTQFEQQQAMLPQQQAQLQQQAQRQQLTEASGVLYGALQSGQTGRAAQMAAQYEPLFKSLDPTFDAQQFAQMAVTPEGLQQLNTELLQLTQVLAGPEQTARFGAQQARPQDPNDFERFQQLEAQRQEIERQQGPEAAARFASFAKMTSRPVSEVNVNLPADKQDVKIAELDAKAFTDYSDRAKTARKELNTINSLKSLSERALSGTGANVMLGAGKLLNQLGFEIDGLTESEVFSMMSNSLVLDKSQQLSGALSDGDMQFLKDTVPGLTTTKEGRRLQLDMAERLARREIEVAQQATIFRREAKKEGREFDDAEFQMFIDAWADQNPIFADLEVKRPSAPAAAIEFLRANPQTRDAFMQKYGYLPEGMN
jgi:hypothetical protein